MLPARGLESGVTSGCNLADRGGCFIKDGKLYCTGFNHQYINLGGHGNYLDKPALMATPEDVTKVVCGGSYSMCVIGASGAVYCRGTGGTYAMGNAAAANPQLTWMTPTGLESDVTDLSYNEGAMNCAVQSGAVKCWGWTFGAQTPTDTGGAVNLSTLSSGVTKVFGGNYPWACAIQNGSLKCWGNNTVGTPGTGVAPSGAWVGPSSPAGGLSTAVAYEGYGRHDRQVGCVSTSKGLYCWGDIDTSAGIISPSKDGNGYTSTPQLVAESVGVLNSPRNSGGGISNIWSSTRDYGTGLNSGQLSQLWGSWTGALDLAGGNEATLATQLQSKATNQFFSNYVTHNQQWYAWDSGKLIACRGRVDFINSGSGSFIDSGAGVLRSTAEVRNVYGLFAGGETGNHQSVCAAGPSGNRYAYEFTPGSSTLCRVGGTDSSSCGTTAERADSSATASALAAALPGTGLRGALTGTLSAITYTMETKYDPSTSGHWAQFNHLAYNSTATIRWLDDASTACVSYMTLHGSTSSGYAFAYAGEENYRSNRTSMRDGRYNVKCAKLNGIWSYSISSGSLSLTLEKKSSESTLANSDSITFAP
jgi:hypothetical protein